MRPACSICQTTGFGANHPPERCHLRCPVPIPVLCACTGSFKAPCDWNISPKGIYTSVCRAKNLMTVGRSENAVLPANLNMWSVRLRSSLQRLKMSQMVWNGTVFQGVSLSFEVALGVRWDAHRRSGFEPAHAPRRRDVPGLECLKQEAALSHWSFAPFSRAGI